MKKRKIAALLVIMLGITGSLLISRISADNKGREDGDIQIPIVNNANIDYAKEGLSLGQTANVIDNKVSYNVTDLVTGVYFQQFVEDNQNLLSNPETSIKDIEINLTDPVLPENITETIFSFELFGKKDIKISSDNNPKAELAYLQAVNTISQNNFFGFTDKLNDILEKWIEQKNSEPLQKYLQGISNEIKDLKQLAVPVNWQEFHLQNLNLWQKKKMVYQAILENNNDPLKAYLAAQEITDIINENAALQKIANTKYEELNKK